MSGRRGVGLPRPCRALPRRRRCGARRAAPRRSEAGISAVGFSGGGFSTTRGAGGDLGLPGAGVLTAPAAPTSPLEHGLAILRRRCLAWRGAAVGRILFPPVAHSRLGRPVRWSARRRLVGEAGPGPQDAPSAGNLRLERGGGRRQGGEGAQGRRAGRRAGDGRVPAGIPGPGPGLDSRGARTCSTSSRPMVPALGLSRTPITGAFPHMSVASGKPRFFMCGPLIRPRSRSRAGRQITIMTDAVPKDHFIGKGRRQSEKSRARGPPFTRERRHDCRARNCFHPGFPHAWTGYLARAEWGSCLLGAAS